MDVSRQENPTYADKVQIDLPSIPRHAQETLAAATLDFIHGILAQAGGREALNKKIAELRL